MLLVIILVLVLDALCPLIWLRYIRDTELTVKLSIAYIFPRRTMYSISLHGTLRSESGGGHCDRPFLEGPADTAKAIVDLKTQSWVGVDYHINMLLALRRG